MKKRTTKKNQCDFCNKLYPSLKQLNQHKKEIHENPKSFGCEICGKKFNQKSILKSHQKTHDKNRSKLFKCHRCDYATDTQQSFKKHQNVHDRQDEKFSTMVNPIKCDKCSTFCKDKAALSGHMSSVHPKVLYQCDFCAKFSKVKSRLVTHMKIHIPRTSKN